EAEPTKFRSQAAPKAAASGMRRHVSNGRLEPASGTRLRTAAPLGANEASGTIAREGRALAPVSSTLKGVETDLWQPDEGSAAPSGKHARALSASSAPPAADESRALVERARDGDGAAFRALFERHREIVARLAYRIVGPRSDLEDLVQEVFV